MPMITMWKCPESGIVFESRVKYYAHLRKLARARLRKRWTRRFADILLADLWRCSSFEEIEDWIVENGRHLATRHELLTGRKVECFTILTAMFSNMRWDEKCPDTRVLLKTDWTCSADPKQRPKSSPGFRGRFVWEYRGILDAFPSDLLEGTKIYTGSGSGWRANRRVHRYDSEVTLFARDWPSLAVMRRLEGQDNSRPY